MVAGAFSQQHDPESYFEVKREGTWVQKRKLDKG
jgi:hypothetical protein